MMEMQELLQVELACPEAEPFFQIGLSSTSFGQNTAAAREQFREFRAIHVKDVLEPALLKSVLALCETSTFETLHASCGSREKEAPQRTGRVVNLTLNRPSLLRWLEEVTGCGPIAMLEGGLGRMLARPEDALMWHDDYPERGRKLAFVLNLSTQPFAGGEFELRRKNGKSFFMHQYTEINSALIFAVGHQFEHRVLSVTAGGPRVVFAGWAFAAGGS